MVRDVRLIMGMPITIEVIDAATSAPLNAAFEHFETVDRRFSPYKSDSELSRINRGEIRPADFSPEMQEVLALAEKTRLEKLNSEDKHGSPLSGAVPDGTGS